MTVDDPALALRRLVLTLQIAAQSLDGDDGGRAAAKLQLKAVINFLDNLSSTTGLETDFRDPLFRLLAALDDLESGHTSLMFKGQAKKGKPRILLENRAAQAFAAAAMDRLMWPKPGLSREEAAKRVARKIRHWDITDIGSEIQFSWQTVAAWRDDLNSGSEIADPGTAVYMGLKQEMAKLPRTKAVKALLLHSQPWHPWRKF